MTPALSPEDSWQPLPPEEWDADAARHLLRRAGWSAQPAEVERARSEGLPETLDRLFPADPVIFPKPALVEAFEAEAPAFALRIRNAQPDERRQMQREYRERAQAALLNMSIRWMQFAARPENSAYEKWVLFLSDVYVVSFAKVTFPQLIYRHFDIIARNGLEGAPALTKAVFASPAMMVYLDLNENQKKAPNENFARELFELFVLGEGNYTENDIKEAARAFTGYRTRPVLGTSYFTPNQHDNGSKTVFGQTGNFDGNGVIDLAYQQRAAGAFLPHEMVKFYLSDSMIPQDHLNALGDAWSADGGYGLRWLAQRFFGSRLFFAREFRGGFIKSPIQFYLGLVQDLGLDVTPIPRYVVNPLRQMGQVLYDPPNVRGWVGGRNWINSGALAARRSLAEALFNPIAEESLNADEQIELVAARTQGAAHFTVADETLKPLAALTAAGAVARLSSSLLAVPPAPGFRDALQEFVAKGAADPGQGTRHLRRTVITLLESPEYQLC